MAAILVVEDDSVQRQALQEFLENVFQQEILKNKIFHDKKLDVYSAADGQLARAVLKEKTIDLVLSDLRLPDCMGIDLISLARKKNPELPFLVLTGEPSIETAIDAIRKGANDYLLKPVDFTLLGKKLFSLLENLDLRAQNENLRQYLNKGSSQSSIVGSSKALQKVLEKINQVAPLDVTVLLEGESGTGKEIFASLLHEKSARKKNPLIKVNCGALTKTLLESELFGVVRGAYTGAEKDRAGYFEAANGSTIFLDEIGEMDMESQVRLLRVLEDRSVIRVGSTKTIPIDTRVIAATNKDLLDEVRKNNFREDLYYRLSVIKSTLPPLRQRKQDIPILFNHFIQQFNKKYNKSIKQMDPQLANFMQAYHWPGNIREFRNTLEGMVILAKKDELDMADLPSDLQEYPQNNNTKHEIEKNILTGFPLLEYEKAILAANLKFFNKNREKTARALGISERTLYRKIKEYELS